MNMKHTSRMGGTKDSVNDTCCRALMLMEILQATHKVPKDCTSVDECELLLMDAHQATCKVPKNYTYLHLSKNTAWQCVG